MSKYKVGDVAALFARPKSPTTEGGKKLQSLFQDFYSKRNKHTFQSSRKETQGENHAVESQESNVQKKNKKRKFSHINDSEARENAFSKESSELCEDVSESKKKEKLGAQDFPRKKRKNSSNSFDASKTFFKNDSDSKPANGVISTGISKGPKGSQQNATFIKKAKRKFNSKNDRFSSSDKFLGALQSKDQSDEDDESIRKEIAEFMKSNSEKPNKRKDHLKQNPQNKIFNSKDQDGIKKQKKKSNTNAEKSSLKNQNVPVEETRPEPEKEVFVGSQNINDKKYTNEQDFPRSKKKSKRSNFDSSDVLKTEMAKSSDDGETSPFKLKESENRDFQQNSLKKWKEHNAAKVSKFKSKDPSSVLDDNSSFQNCHELKISSERKLTTDVIGKPKKNKAKNIRSELSKEMSDKETLDNSGPDALSKKQVADSNDVRRLDSKKNKFNAFEIQKSLSKKLEQLGEPDFIKLPSSKEKDDALSRTLFVNNLPVTTPHKALKDLFSAFGEIERIRFNGIETDKAKIYSKNRPKTLNPKYAADTIPGFIVYKERESAVAALSLSGSVFKGHHITVDFALPAGSHKIYDDKRSIFIGNLPFDVEDESIWNAFTECGRIESVRAVRDHDTGIGKGFGYVLFSTVQAKENALALKDVEIDGRSVRIKPASSNRKAQKSESLVPKRNTFKSKAIRIKKNKKFGSRKSVNKLTKKLKTSHNKKKIASIMQRSLK